MSKNKIGVIGMGPTGAILAAYLAANGEDVAIADIQFEHIEAIKRKGLRITGLDEISVKIPKAYTSVSLLKKCAIDILFIATKTFSLKSVLREVRGIYREGMKIVCYQNGISNEEMIADRFGAENSLRAVVNHAGNIEKPGVINMTFFHKPNYIGTINEEPAKEAKNIAKIMTAAGLDTEYTKDIKFHVWQKAIFNTALAPVSAVTGQMMKEVMGLSETRNLVETLLREAIAVAEANDVKLGKDFFEKGIRYLGTAGNHRPSMRIDIEAGRRTEIDFITGKIVEYGEKTNCDCPVNLALYSLVKGMEMKL